jgi:tRNA threonylcarbamoyladenosine modification (KEOPS) complex  Pcc1 subunit
MSGEVAVASARCRLSLQFDSHETAEKVHKSVELDNLGYLSSKVIGREIVAEVSSESLKSLLHTVDDFLACTGVASKIVSKRD